MKVAAILVLACGALLGTACSDESGKALRFGLQCDENSCDNCNQDLQLLAQGGSVTVAAFVGDSVDPFTPYQCLVWDDPLTLGQLPEPLNSKSLSFSFEPDPQTLIFRFFVSSDRSGDCPPSAESYVATGTSAALIVSEPDQAIQMFVTCPTPVSTIQPW